MGNYKWIIGKIQEIPFEKTYVKYLENQLHLLAGQRFLQAVSYDGVGGNGGISDKTGDTAIRITEEEAELKLKIDKKRSEIELLEGIINALGPDERKVIDLMYRKKKSYSQTSKEMGIAKSTVQEKRKKALDKILSLYNIKE